MLGGAAYLLVGLIPVFLGLMAAHSVGTVPDAEQIVPRLAEVFLPGTLRVAFIGAVISAILSAVDAALHAPASQISHNIVVRLVPGLTDRGKLWSVRLTVMMLSIVAYFLSVTSRRIHDLVETASAFGSAGVFDCLRFSRASAGPRAPSVGGGGHVGVGRRQIRGGAACALPCRAAGGDARLCLCYPLGACRT